MDKDGYGRITKLISDTVIMLCKNGVHFDHHLRVQGVIGVTIDDGTVFLVHMNDRISGDECSSADISKPVQRSVESEVCSHQSNVDVANEQNETEECQWSKTPEASASEYLHGTHEREASKTRESQNAADCPASLTAGLSFVQQNILNDDVTCVESTSSKTSVGSSSAASAVCNPYRYSVQSAAGYSDSSAREICHVAKTQANYAPLLSDNSQYSKFKSEFRERGVTHYLSTPRPQSFGIGSSPQRNMVIVLYMCTCMLKTS